jgi:hypothetical protein
MTLRTEEGGNSGSQYVVGSFLEDALNLLLDRLMDGYVNIQSSSRETVVFEMDVTEQVKGIEACVEDS